MVELDEVIALEVQPLNAQDTVVYPPGPDSLRINIFDNDGKGLALRTPLIECAKLQQILGQHLNIYTGEWTNLFFPS